MYNNIKFSDKRTVEAKTHASRNLRTLHNNWFALIVLPSLSHALNFMALFPVVYQCAVSAYKDRSVLMKLPNLIGHACIYLPTGYTTVKCALPHAIRG